MRTLYIIFMGILVGTTYELPLYADSWAKAFGGDSTDYAYSVKQTSDNGYIVAGETHSYGAGKNDFLVIRLDSAGVIKWAKTFGGDSSEIAYSVSKTQDNGYIVAGETRSFGAGSSDFLVIKLDSLGNVLWAKTFGDTLHDGAVSISPTSDGGYIIAGSHGSVIKLDSSSNVSWSKTFDINNLDILTSLSPTSDGGYIIAGLTGNDSDTDCLVIKLDSLGNIDWSKTFDGGDHDVTLSVCEDSSGNYMLAGKWSYYGDNRSDCWLIQLDSLGDIIWSKVYGGSGRNWAFSVSPIFDTGYVVAGWTNSLGVGKDDVTIIKLDSIGDIIWSKTFGGTDYEKASSISQTSDNSYIVTGYTTSFGTNEDDFLVVKLEADGSMDASCPIQDCSPIVSDVTDSINVNSVIPDTSSPSIISKVCTLEVSSPSITVTDICGQGVEDMDSRLQIADSRLEVYPNPFVQSTVISYQLSKNLTTKNQQLTTVSLTIHDISGRLIREFPNPQLKLGRINEVVWDAKDDKEKQVPSGVYYCVLNADGKKTSKMIVVK
ncbi:T9SS type A sorting domain-containing protein [candidate division WOR-3 bacterium]|nr:T9SS type A sorting domain-containing protein [candidate division WOR-3 bacterium]